jgi:serine/threonine protein kinase
LKTALVNDRDDDERLRDEARVGLRLSHPHIVETVDCFEHEGRPVLATGYVVGATILQLRQHPLSPAAVCRVGRHIADALDAIHECTDGQGRRLGVLHRDVTAGNVIVDENGDARLIDLGIARSHESRAMRTETGLLRGTLRYLAPELFDGGQQSAQSDLWALGVVLWEALLGRPAVLGSDVVAMGRICSGNLMALEPGERPEPRVQRAIAQLLQRSTADRPRRARDAAALFAMVLRELGDDGRALTAGAVRQALQGTRGSNAKNACGLGLDGLSLPETAVVPPQSSSSLVPSSALSPMMPLAPPMAGMPPTQHDQTSEPMRTPSQGLLDYAARLSEMERSLVLAWGQSEQHSREALRGLPVVTGRPIDDVHEVEDVDEVEYVDTGAGVTAQYPLRSATPMVAALPAAPTPVAAPTPAAPTAPPHQGPFGDVPLSRIPTPSLGAMSGPGALPSWRGGRFPSAMPMPPHTPVYLPPAFMRGALDAITVEPPRILPDEPDGPDGTTASTGNALAALAPLSPHVMQESAFAIELAAMRRRNAALTVLLVLAVVAFGAYVLVTRLHPG